MEEECWEGDLRTDGRGTITEMLGNLDKSWEILG